MTVATLPRELAGVDPGAAALELQRRRAARLRLLDFTLATYPEYEPGWHHAVVAHFLDLLLERKITRLMVNMPPQNGKSELGSRRLPALALGQNPDARVIAASYSADLAGAMNLDVQRVIDSNAYARLFPETRLFGEQADTTGSWRRTMTLFEIVGRRGYLLSAGIGGGITGRGFDVGIIDDPVKNREEAESETFRDAQWDWYTSTFRTRASDTAVILVMMTRWHEDDLSGRLLVQARTDDRADQWVVLSLPAIASEGPHTMTLSINGQEVIEEIDGREIGDALWPEKFSLAWLSATEASIGPYDWAALYDQTPAPRKGGMFQRDWIRVVDAIPAEIVARVRYWDKAGTEGGGAYSAGVLMSRAFDGTFLIEDVKRAQLSSGRREALIKQTARLDGPEVEIWIEQEPGSGGKESAELTIRNLVGFDIHAETSTGDKVTRARPFSAQAEAGNVRVLAGPWNGEYIDELVVFPRGRFKDQVDASSGAFNKLALAEAQETYELTELVEISPF